MRRPRTSLTAWPAFADLMTILAVVGLTAAITIVSSNLALKEKTAHMENEINVRDAKIDTLNEINGQLQDSLDARNDRIDSLSNEVAILKTTIRFGARPCLGTQDRKPKVLLRIVVVNQGYRLEPRWPPEEENKVAKIPALLEAVARGQLEPTVFEHHATTIYRYGETEDTFDGSCRFFVHLEKDTDSYRRFAQAVGSVNRYFLIANSSEVNRILAEGE